MADTSGGQSGYVVLAVVVVSRLRTGVRDDLPSTEVESAAEVST
jgi:hypothetical protein